MRLLIFIIIFTFAFCHQISQEKTLNIISQIRDQIILQNLIIFCPSQYSLEGLKFMFSEENRTININNDINLKDNHINSSIIICLDELSNYDWNNLVKTNLGHKNPAFAITEEHNLKEMSSNIDINQEIYYINPKTLIVNEIYQIGTDTKWPNMIYLR